ncbi:MAG: hypothetical protein H7263_07100 [Candidatus Sericytochromatia bacterium]|nr:hypothetical protein [Candidatus Sericytochromatia bacterium]
MKTKFIMMSAVLALASITTSAQAGGCLKGAAVGGVGGHVGGGHGVLGAVAGCAVGRHMYNKKQKAKQNGQVTK